jgi:hypothetical protein
LTVADPLLALSTMFLSANFVLKPNFVSIIVFLLQMDVDAWNSVQPSPSVARSIQVFFS